MSILRKLEDKIQDIFEGGFGRAFKSRVHPVELARKLVKEMEDNKVISVSRIYVPNEYTLYLSPEDYQQFEAYRDHLAADLAEYISESARRDGYQLISAPTVLFETDEDLELGEFGIATRMVSRGESRPGEPAAADVGRTAIYRPRPADDGTAVVAADEAQRLGLARERVTLDTGSESYEISGRVTLIGRSRHADIVLADPNVSRRHAEIRKRGGDFVITDLGSLNGVEVNGKRVTEKVLEDGDVITLGTTMLRFERKPC